MASGEPLEVGKLSKELLKCRSGEFDLESIHTVSLSRLDLDDISMIGECSGLERLDLSYNDISGLHVLASLANLIVLDLSANRLTSLDGLQALDNLEKLDVSGNLIGAVDSLKAITSLTKLSNIRLRDSIRGISNPICVRETYKSEVTKLLPRLICLDWEILKGPGSELFKLIDELETCISTNSPREGPFNTAQPPTDLPPKLYELPSLDSSLQCDAEDRLRATLAECNQLNDRGDKLIKEMEEKLNLK